MDPGPHLCDILKKRKVIKESRTFFIGRRFFVGESQVPPTKVSTADYCTVILSQCNTCLRLNASCQHSFYTSLPFVFFFFSFILFYFKFFSPACFVYLHSFCPSFFLIFIVFTSLFFPFFLTFFLSYYFISYFVPF